MSSLSTGACVLRGRLALANSPFSTARTSGRNLESVGGRTSANSLGREFRDMANSFNPVLRGKEIYSVKLKNPKGVQKADSLASGYLGKCPLI